ncbi:TPA: hypothetical protein ACHWKL_002958 [Providencia stuartii]|uniref:hypothetical protein n=1 Tax=Providencia stuartii TaxID=588 RepID=UPI00114037B4|nr:MULTISPECIES: hypothetical protein [Providencia]MBN5562958.1 hypothetical protein [Providencia stuartii]MBN5602956.1 hypothetical protein [Providencia stuartii]MBN5606982.1 hypothetical protein [Providencia stuartii]MDF4176146.1 hypothetical protein [Providencia thailandensis]MDN0012391.1 hypothetical protein [Providencia stuartii]
MIYKIKNIQEIIYDGFEDDFYDLPHSFKCPLCHENIIIDILNLKPFRLLDEEVKNTILFKMKKIKVSPLSSTSDSYNYNFLPIYYDMHECNSNSKKILRIIASGEHQPARYQIILIAMCI